MPWSEDRPGFYRLTVARTNCYLIVTADGATLVDAGLPATRRPFEALLRHLRMKVSDLDAVILTHGHFDHVGLARPVHAAGVPVLVHPGDERLARHPYRYRPAAARVPYLLRHPTGIPVIGRMALAGALGVRGVEAMPQLADATIVDVPGRPRVIFTPGHTDGHCALLFEADGVLVSGDALVTCDPYTGRTGPQIVADAATSDPERALRSLDVLDATGAGVVLTGHGDPWTSGVTSAVRLARVIGEH